MCKNSLNSNQQKSVEQANFKQVNDTLFGKYGDKTPEVMEQKAKELGTTLAELENISRSNPTMALTLLGEAATQPQVGRMTGGMNTTNLRQPVETLDADLEAAKAKLFDSGSKQDVELMRKIRADVYRELNITQ